MKLFLNWLINSWEHCEDVDDDALSIIEELTSDFDLQNRLKTEVSSLMNSWLNNDDNMRLDVELNYHKNPSLYEEKLMELVRTKVKSIKL